MVSAKLAIADRPAERHQGVAVERDDRLREREGEHVEHAAEREHGERAPAELGVVQDLDGERAEQERTDDADHADGSHEPQQPAEARCGTRPSRPRAARRDSRGSSAACTAWKRNSGTRARITP